MMILIIRPKTETNTIVHDLRERNCSLFLEPVSEIKFINLKTNFDSNGFFLISSLQTVKALALLKNIDHQFFNNANFLVIGNKTAQRCKSLGIKNINKVFFSSLDLIDYLDQNKQINQLNHLTGSVKNEILEEWSKINRQLIKKTILYKTVSVNKLKLKTIKSIKRGEIKILTLFSIFTAKTFFKLLRKHKLINDIYDKDIYIMCLSKRISDYVLHSEGFIEKKRLKWSPKPSQNALIMCIKKFKKNEKKQ